MGSITSVTASPTTIAPGGTSKITPVVVPTPGSSKVEHVVITEGTATGAADVTVSTPAEALTYSVDPADKGKPGTVVCTTDSGTVTYNGDGTFTLHA